MQQPPTLVDVSRTLYVAAGGGGDAIAAALLHAARGDLQEPAVVASYAWDRLLIDPLPGPRSPRDFDGLQAFGSHNFQIVAESKPRPPAGSTLPHLAQTLPARLMLLDPYGGARGMAQQLAELVDLTGAGRIEVVDVGGDALAQGRDPGLRSPLADALALAAAADIELPGSLLVIGPGLDGELPQEVVQKRLSQLDADKVLDLEDSHLSDKWIDMLAWHPSEATALWIAAGLGLRGTVEIRDAGTPVNLTDAARGVWAIDLGRTVEANPIARAILKDGPPSLDAVEAAVIGIVGSSELEYERAKAARSTAEPYVSVADLEPKIAALEDAARSRGATYVTFRRLAEGLGHPSQLHVIREWLIQAHAERYTPPLWSVAA